MATEYANGKIVTNGLVLSLDAADKNSYPGTGTTWRDVSGNNGNGTLVNGPTFNSNNGGSIVFDGSNDYATIGNSGFPTGASARTVSAWAYTNTISSIRWILFYGTTSASQGCQLAINGTTYIFGAFVGDHDITATGVPLSTWFNLVGVYTGTQCLMYVNGVLISGPSTRTFNTTGNNAFIATRATTELDSAWNGRIANILIYNRALTSAEVLQNYNATCTRFGLPPFREVLLTTFPVILGTVSGLFGRRYVGYFNDDVAWFASATLHGDTQQTTEISSFSISADNYSWMWLGYFYSPTTGTYTFYTTSDDASYIWVGNNAISGYTTGNALVNNGGAHAAQERSGTITLTGGQYTPIRIMYGEATGGQIMTVSFAGPSISKTTNGSGYYFDGDVSLFSTWG